jgi:PIN domain nuclease of toxin-antitoxin system
VSAITLWEIAMWVATGRLVLARDVQTWVDDVLALPALRLAPLVPAIAVASTRAGPACRLTPAPGRSTGYP